MHGFIYFLLTIFVILPLWSYIFYEFFVNKIEFKIYSIRSNKIKRTDCDPIFKDKKSYSINIQGEIYPKLVYLSENQLINFDCLNKSNQTKVLSIRTTNFKDGLYGLKTGIIKPFENINCPVTNCEFTNDENKLNKSDLVLFEMNRKISKYIPKRRFTDQRYVFVLYESPIRSTDFKKYRNFFNLTSTYEMDSDFPGFYSSWNFKWEKNESFNENYDFSKNKLKFATGLISNCNDKAKRIEYLNELKKYIPVDIFGKCGEKCPDFYSNTTIKDDCRRILAKEYKFFLAFENSICKDYITEKFFQILSFDIIPVVRSGGYYDRYIPKSGYIDAFDFKSAEHLAEYLIYLDSNKTAYNEYFKWKKFIKFYNAIIPVKNHGLSPICDMCIYLHLEDFYGMNNKIIKDPHSIYNCKNYSYNFPFIILIVLFVFVCFIFILK